MSLALVSFCVHEGVALGIVRRQLCARAGEADDWDLNVVHMRWYSRAALVQSYEAWADRAAYGILGEPPHRSSERIRA